jgi:beta-RFAP synthase
MISIRTPSRLHFGFFSLPREEPATSSEEQSIPARSFGGVGLMIEAPGLQLTTEAASSWSAEGPLAERALAFARQFAQSSPELALSPQRIRIEQAAPEHLGLGTGTQLGLAVARALAISSRAEHLLPVDLATRVGRGIRSALGIHGFAQGGFLVEAGKRPGSGVSPLVARRPFPETWRVVLVLPPWGQGLHGTGEHDAFRRLRFQAQDGTTGTLCRLAVLGMLPSLVEHDWEGFGEALYEFNVGVGKLFAPVQGGIYADPRVAELVAWIRRQGVPGAGQSSWGPAIFAVLPDEQHAAFLAEEIRRAFSLKPTEVLVTRASNAGAKGA